MPRNIDANQLIDEGALGALGLSREMVAAGVTYAHGVLDGIDATLIRSGEVRLARLLELANVSAIIGNLLRGGLAKASNGRFAANGPHKYPDLLSREAGVEDLEIKVALETNKPKGHLAKPGPHLTCRYVLADERGRYVLGKENRGDVAWIWEVRVGVLEEHHFSISNTAGDSGKTAVINKDGFERLRIAYCDLELCPYGPRSRIRRSYETLMRPQPDLLAIAP